MPKQKSEEQKCLRILVSPASATAGAGEGEREREKRKYVLQFRQMFEQIWTWTKRREAANQFTSVLYVFGILTRA